jgi:hypothetical protein
MIAQQLSLAIRLLLSVHHDTLQMQQLEGMSGVLHVHLFSWSVVVPSSVVELPKRFIGSTC